MPKPPSVDLAMPSLTLGTAVPRPIEEFTVKELKDELLRRGNVDFSKWEVLVKLSPFILLFCAVFIYKLRMVWDGTLWGCLLQ